ncbi:MAG: DUF1684 domain-containing protein [Cytophagales bacterium]|nr:DUF1684 domain-containing protein [Cytophaga sp.]
MKAKYNSIKRKQILRVLFVLGALFIIGSLFFSGLKVESDSDILIKYREQKDDHFRKSIKSPITDKASFNGLTYFEPNSNYKVKAYLEFTKDTIIIFMPRNDGKQSAYIAFATANFKIKQKLYKLMLYKLPDENESKPTLFLPFYDKTNGSTTYSGGRFLDLDMTNNKTMTIDFNYAYNPFCVYNYQYTCPIPPKENYIDTEIPAGEKMFDMSHAKP